MTMDLHTLAELRHDGPIGAQQTADVQAEYRAEPDLVTCFERPTRQANREGYQARAMHARQMVTQVQGELAEAMTTRHGSPFPIDKRRARDEVRACIRALRRWRADYSIEWVAYCDAVTPGWRAMRRTA